MNTTVYEHKTVLIDLDDTLHAAEDPLMGEGWNHLLLPWGRIWKAYEGSDPGDLIPVTEEERPGVGVNTLQVIRHFIETFHLTLDQLQEDVIRNGSFIFAQQILALKDECRGKDMPMEDLIDLLEKERIAFLTRWVGEYGVTPLPGAAEMVQRIHDAGYKLGIVTHSSLGLASIILAKLGLSEPI